MRNGDSPTCNKVTASKSNEAVPTSRLVNFVGHGIMTCISLWLAFMVFTGITMYIPPIDTDKIELLQPGMSKEEVTKVLGSPTHDGDEQWTYAGWGWTMLHVYFDADGRFESSEYDD